MRNPQDQAVELGSEAVDAIARRLEELLAPRIAQLVEPRAAGAPELIDAREVSRRFGVSRDWVYAHSEELGAVRLGAGSKPRLRFDPARVLQALTDRAEADDPPPSRPAAPAARLSRRRTSSPRPHLLP